MHNLLIRKEEPADYPAVFDLVAKAFEREELSDHREQFLVERLRKSAAFIPELSMVAEHEGKIVGYILLTKIIIENGSESYDSLALAPVAVLPEFHGRGVGGRLIIEAHKIASDLGHKSVVLLGHEGYYPKFGYQQAEKFGISLPFEVPKENCMAIELVKDGLKDVNGVVRYPAEFDL